MTITRLNLKPSGDTMTGPLTIKAGNMDRDGANPSSDTYFSAYRIVDKDGEIVGLIRPRRYTNGTQYLQFCVFNEDSSNAEIVNTVQAWLGKDGSKGFSAEGQIAISNGQFRATSTNITEGYTSTNTEGNGRLYFMSNDGKIICRIHPWQVAGDGTQRLRILVQRVVSGTMKYNGLNLGVNSAGEALIAVEGTNAAASWRAAIGANSATNLTAGTLPNARIAYASKDYTSAKTYGAIQFRKWGRMCTCDVNSFKSLASGSNTLIASLDAAYRPVVDVSMTRTDPGDGKRYRVMISAAGVVAIYAYSTPASTVNIDDTFTYATAS